MSGLCNSMVDTIPHCWRVVRVVVNTEHIHRVQCLFYPFISMLFIHTYAMPVGGTMNAVSTTGKTDQASPIHRYFLENLEQGDSPEDSSQTNGRLQVAPIVTHLQASLQSHLMPQPLHLPPQQDSHLDCLVPQEHQNSQ